MSQNYSKAEEEYRAEYEETLKDYIQNFQNEIIIKTEELKIVNKIKVKTFDKYSQALDTLFFVPVATSINSFTVIP